MRDAFFYKMHPVFYCIGHARRKNGANQTALSGVEVLKQGQTRRRFQEAIGVISFNSVSRIALAPHNEGTIMRKQLPPLPRGFELGLFAVLAVVCAVCTGLFAARELALAIMAVPIFIGCAFLGMRRSGQWQSFSEPIDSPAGSSIDLGDSME
jgi:hypothetical protein